MQVTIQGVVHSILAHIRLEPCRIAVHITQTSQELQDSVSKLTLSLTLQCYCDELGTL